MLFRKWFIVIGLLALLMGVGVMGAQQIETFCGTLSADDCALLTRTREAQIDSAATRFDLEFELHTGDTQSDFRIEVSGSGAFVGSFAPLLETPNLNSLPGTEAVQAMVDIMRAFDARLDMTIRVPPVLAPDMPLGADEIVLEIRMIGGIVLINLDPLQPVIADNTLEGWAGMDVASFLEELLERDPSLFDEIGAGTNSSAGRIAEIQAEVAELTGDGDAGEIERVGRSDPGEARFVTTVDFGELLDNPRVADLLREAIDIQFEAQQPELSRRERQQALEIAFAIFQALEFRIVEDVTLETELPQSFRIELFLDLINVNLRDMGLLTGFVLLNFDATFEDINAVDEIAMPPTPFLLPYRFLIDELIRGQI